MNRSGFNQKIHLVKIKALNLIKKINITYLSTNSLRAARIIIGIICLYDIYLKFLNLDFYTETVAPFSKLGLYPNTFSSFYKYINFFQPNNSLIYYQCLLIVMLIVSITLICDKLVILSLGTLWISFLAFDAKFDFKLKTLNKRFLLISLFFHFFSAINIHLSKSPRKKIISNSLSFFWFLQISLLYIFSFLNKAVSPIWAKDFSALSGILHLPLYGTPYTEFVVGFPDFLKLLTLLTILVELLVPFLLLLSLLRDNSRKYICLFYILFHLIISFFLNVNFFAPIMISAWISFLPSNFWSYEKEKSHSKPIRNFFQIELVFCILSCLVIYFNITNFVFNFTPKRNLMKAVGLNQTWNMMSFKKIPSYQTWLLFRINFKTPNKLSWDPRNQINFKLNFPEPSVVFHLNYEERSVIEFYSSYLKKNPVLLNQLLSYEGKYQCNKFIDAKDFSVYLVSRHIATKESNYKELFNVKCI